MKTKGIVKMRTIKEIGEEIVREYGYLQKRQEDILAAFFPLRQRDLKTFALTTAASAFSCE